MAVAIVFKPIVTSVLCQPIVGDIIGIYAFWYCRTIDPLGHKAAPADIYKKIEPARSATAGLHEMMLMNLLQPGSSALKSGARSFFKKKLTN
ncbi:MAG: hypothetical protein Q7U40_00450 [Desulfatirhabdiaceae bacterium]|nr:hypothetical protein [Desulfatirhabdiaceae bacterium]